MKGSIARLAGRLLRGVHAGDTHLSVHHPRLKGVPQTIQLRSAWFAAGGAIPGHAAGQGVGANVSPPLEWTGAPDETRGYLLILQDPDVPLRRPFVHLIALGIPATRRFVAAGELAEDGPFAPFGRNTAGRRGYQGPRALPAHGPHRYVFHLLALRVPPVITTSNRLDAILAANMAHVIAHGTLVGTFEQK